MNAKAMMKTHDAIADNPDGYNQNTWSHSCGTPACVAGYCVVAHGGKIVLDDNSLDVFAVWKSGDVVDVETAAMELLGLTQNEADAMFPATPLDEDGLPFFNPAPQHAMDMLKHAAETGVVRWRRELPQSD